MEPERFVVDLLEAELFFEVPLDFFDEPALDFFVVDFFAVDFFVVDFFAVDFFDEDFGGGGTLPPSRRASDKPIAIACFLLFTFWPELLRSFPSFNSCIVCSTFSCDFFPYFVAMLNPPAQLFVQAGSPALP